MPISMKGIVKGGLSIVKTTAGFDVADDGTISLRLAKCERPCPSRREHPTYGPYCAECGCVLKYKTRDASAECPKGEW